MSHEAQTVGNYRIVEKLGEGGMGEVYLARDTRLGRDVAIKMLPPAFARDVERLARFRREALTLAALNHPNIATIFGFEEASDGSLAIVLERVEGETLGERIARAKPTVEEALAICDQIAEALEMAHERGVVHRDLKPGNVMIGPRGIVKVLDFGLAQISLEAAAADAGPASVAESAAPADTESATAAPPPVSGTPGASSRLDPPSLAEGSEPKTEVGAVVGTPGYMSPEQAVGGEIDARADIFSFGCLLYECLSGARAFQADSEFELTAAVMYGQPDMNLMPERMPVGVRELLESCLEKDPDTRLADIRSARLQIEEALGIRRASALRAGEALAEARHNLPKQLTTFIGRETELAACRELLATTKLLTLTGVGGSGKTRLSLKLAEERLSDHPDGVWAVNFAAISGGERVVETVALALGVKEDAGRPLQQTLGEYLKARNVLLVLDNCEHVSPACAELATALLEQCADVQIIATSREPLNVAGELVHPIPTLALPGKAATQSAEAAAQFESVQLFVERAGVARQGFEFTDAEAPAVTDICRRLDGIPLAIELAAARVRMLGVEQIRAKLDDRFRLLTGGSRSALPRQQTLHATIQWSYDQLAKDEQQFFRSLAVFRGGWTLGTATAICMESGDEFEVLDLLTRLVDKSMVVVSQDDPSASRYRFLETVRHYAMETLKATDEGSSVRDRHVTFFLALGETAEKELTGPEQSRWFRELESEHENLLAAITGSAGTKNGAETALRLAGSLSRFWSAHGHFEIGRRTLLQALELGDPADVTEPRAKASVRAASLSLLRGDYPAARKLLEQGLAIYRKLEDLRGVARSLSGLAAVAICQSDFAAAEKINAESLESYTRLGQKRGMALSLHDMGFVARCVGDLETSRTRYEKAVELLREVGDQASLSLALTDLGVTSMRSGQIEGTSELLREALFLAGSLGAQREAAVGLDAAAELALARGEFDRAARYMGAAGALRDEIGLPLIPVEAEDHAKLEALVAEGFPEAERVAASAEGRTMDLKGAVADALAWLDSTHRA